MLAKIVTTNYTVKNGNNFERERMKDTKLFEFTDKPTECEVKEKIFTVSEFNLSIKELIESKRELKNIALRGEISSFTAHASGHLYFSLKDDKSVLSCVMFRGAVSTLKFKPKTGDKIIVKGSAGVYPTKGSYQLIVTQITEDGLGDLHKKLLLLKEKLEKEGLFAEEHKKELPKIPRVIGVITSESGAVFHDICHVVRRRFPHVKILLFPAAVQGNEAAPTIVKAIKLANSVGNVNVIILARGGGSLEDLWCFNEEIVAHAIFESKIPIVSAIGHEINYTIADLVADRRAPTPSAAAEIVVPEIIGLTEGLKQMAGKLVNSLQEFVNSKGQELDDNSSALVRSVSHIFKYKSMNLDKLLGKLDSLNPSAVLKRGFSLTTLKGKIVLNSTQVKKGDRIISVLSKGQIRSKVGD